MANVKKLFAPKKSVQESLAYLKNMGVSMKGGAQITGF